ncbi:MAG TPA: DUF1634 domain-containing protein [Vicinamibacterales bacterium]|jgi:uncharacterized membrane protein
MIAPDVGRLERWLGRVLRIGVTTSTTLLAVGLVLQLAGGNARLAGLLTTAGLLVLMATPVGRVVISVAEYVLERDWPFFALTTTVLAILLGSLVVALL